MGNHSAVGRVWHAVVRDFKRSWGCWCMYVACAIGIAASLRDDTHGLTVWIGLAAMWCGYAHLTNRDFHELFDPAMRSINNASDRIAELELDRDYYRALVLGAWPDADAVIASARTRQAAKEQQHGS
jgi:hypothetical protein